MTIENILQTINIIILGITALIIWKYTKATRESNEIRIRPVLNLYLRKENQIIGVSERFTLRNIGNGTAYNILIEYADNLDTEYLFKFFLDQPNIILEPHKDEKILRFIPLLKNGGISSFGIETFKKYFSPDTLENLEKYKVLFAIFLVHYQNINGKTFYSVFKFYTKHPATNEFIIEFIDSSEGRYTLQNARKICSAREKINSNL